MEYIIAHIGHTLKSHEHVTWWKPDSRGYTICIDKAGRYSEGAARSVCQYGGSIAVPVGAAESLVRSTPYYRTKDGNLAKLYDGGPHRPVENEAQAWRHLLSNRLLCSKTTERPTPMPRGKARAIYLDDTDAILVPRMREELRCLEHKAWFYKRRVEALQQWQSSMRDPERTVVCDILANGFTLDPPIPHDRYELKS